MLEFFIPCNPSKATAQGSSMIMKRKNPDGTYTRFVGRAKNSKAEQTKKELILLLQSHRPAKPFEGPVSLMVVWAYPWRKSEPKKNRDRWVACDTRPDCDNLSKLLCDVLTRLNFWKDDSQVAHLNFWKIWSNKPGIKIKIKEMI